MGSDLFALSRIIADFQRDKKFGGNYPETFRRKFVHSLYLHRYELWALKPYYRKGKVLNVGAGRDCGKLGDNVVSLDKRKGVDDYTMLAGWPAIQPDVVGDADNPLPFYDGVFDCVFSMHMLEHLRNPVFSFKEMLRVTRPSGFVAGILPCRAHNKDYNYWRDETHLHSWTRYDFHLWLSQQGFLGRANLIQYCRMKKWLNGWSFDFVLQKFLS
ncbi:MAG: class I SAM-dependent methyltransferase [bacterium]